MRLLLLSVSVICLSLKTEAGTTRGDLNKVKAGIDAGNAITKIFDNDHFGKIGELASHITPFLGAIGPVMSFFTLFTPSPEVQRWRKMVKNFKEMNDKLDRVMRGLSSVESLIKDQGLKAQFSKYDLTIISLYSRLQDILTAKSNLKYYIGKFMEEYKDSDKGAVNKIWIGMTTNSTTIRNNIPSAVVDNVDNDRKQFDRAMKSVIGVILKGIEVELAHLTFEKQYHNRTVAESYWDKKMNQLEYNNQKYDQIIAGRWNKQYGKDIDSKLRQWNTLSQSSFADRLYDFLKDKYFWRDWYVTAYSVLGGSDNYNKVCDGTGIVRYNSHGRNLVVVSVEQNKTAIDKPYAYRNFGKVTTWSCHQQYSRVGRTKCNGVYAKNTYNSFPDKLKNGCEYAALGVIQRYKENFWGSKTYIKIKHKGPFERRECKDNGRYRLHTFG